MQACVCESNHGHPPLLYGYVPTPARPRAYDVSLRGADVLIRIDPYERL
jgi:hypothetical protein